MTETFTVGQRIQLEWGKHRYDSRIRGWKKGGYVLVDTEWESGESHGVRAGQELVARFAMGGKSYGFVTTVAQFLYEYKIAALAYPEHIELNEEDYAQRFPFSAPVDIMQSRSDDELVEWRGVGRELSLEGVQIVSKQPVDKGGNLFLSFPLITGGKVDNVRSVVKKITRVRDGFELELDYVFLSNENRRALDAFIDMASTHSGLLP